ncbi:hypothetical protein HaloA020_28980 [Halomonas sp. A020]|uniref:hypothetical protein n=1 Tax=Halomonas sp. A020 TaxID=2717374 RepID=UPI0024921149|nr:hypothetical protein [Halomonas sp. A020]BCB62197.1 hypothetical protein HaloA020_28980 [Halomonas sp. A020]
MNRAALSRTYRRLSPQHKAVVEQEAAQRGVAVEDVMLDHAIAIAGPLKDQLYAMRRERTLRAV